MKCTVRGCTCTELVPADTPPTRTKAKLADILRSNIPDGCAPLQRSMKLKRRLCRPLESTLWRGAKNFEPLQL
jgi:hypothetical protein